jgi:hypothetical protein
LGNLKMITKLMIALALGATPAIAQSENPVASGSKVPAEVSGTAAVLSTLAQTFPDTAVIAQFKTRAASGDSSAMLSHAEIYLIQPDKSRDMQPAIEWFRRAADAGRVEAMLRLYDVYGFQLRDKPGAKAEEMRWMNAAKATLEAQANKGDVTAEYHLGYVCDLAEDREGAIRWYRKAASENSAAAMYALGTHYKLSWDVPENASESARWLTLASAKGYVKAMRELADDYGQGYGVQLDANKAREWSIKADRTERTKAEAGNQDAMIELGARELREGNAEDGVRQLSRAADAGNYLAATALALAYTLGKGMPRDVEKAAQWRALAQKIGLPLDKFNWPEGY